MPTSAAPRTLAAPPAPPLAWVRTAYTVALVLVTGSVVMGSVVAATGSSAACPTWPGCYPGELVPHADASPVIEMTHRVVAMSAGPAILACLAASFTRPRAERLSRLLPWLTLLGAIAAAVFGRITVLYGLPAPLGVLDLGLSLVAMISITAAAVAVRRHPYAVRLGREARLAWGAVATLLVMHVLGILTAGPGSFTRVMGWPVWRIVDSDVAPGLQVVRILLAALATGLLAAAVWSAWRREDLHHVALALAALWAVELACGLAMGGHPVSWFGATFYAVVAVGIVFCAGLLASLAAIETVYAPAPAIEAIAHTDATPA